MGSSSLSKLHAIKHKLARTQIASHLTVSSKFAGESTGGKLLCVSALHRLKRSWSGLTNTLAGVLTSEKRESKPCQDGRVWSIINADIHPGQQSVTGCMLQTFTCFSQCHVLRFHRAVSKFN